MATLSDGALADEDDIEFLLDGIAEIGAPGAPGPLCVYGPDAFPVVVGATAETRAPVVAAGRWEAGRVVAFGHGAYFERATIETGDTGGLLENALQWAAGGNAAPRIGVVGWAELRAWLTDSGYDAVETSLAPEHLSTVDVVAVEMWNQSIAESDALAAFVEDGGGLVTASTGWGWAQLHPDLDLAGDFAGNRLLAAVGLQWADYEHVARTSELGYAIEGVPSPLTHALDALDAVEDHDGGRRVLSLPESDQAVGTLQRAARCLPPGDRLLAPRLSALVKGKATWPGEDKPVDRDDVVVRLAVTLDMIEHERLPPESLRAHPAAADFPGAVPTDAPRIERSLVLDTATSQQSERRLVVDPPEHVWHSTGLYAAPGEPVTVIVPPPAADSGALAVRVGAHIDGIWHLPVWWRMPQISRRFTVSAARTLVGNAFGGLIYVEVKNGVDLGSVPVEIQGAVAAPRFVLGETDPAAWREDIRHAPAPWAEIEGRNMIVTTDSREVRQLDHPTEVAETWDSILDLAAELAGWSGPRAHPERFVVDRQLPAGYMLAAYPIRAHMDQKAHLVDAAYLRTCAREVTQGNWGFFHEVGHNHQSADWTFDGTVEVTVNLFTLYVYEFLCGIPVAENWRGSPRFRTEQMARYDFDHPDFEQWKSDPFLALVMYEQLQQEFGWDAFRTVFAEYLGLAEGDHPKSDDEKRDQWLVRLSRTVGSNLGPFFEAWGVPTSQVARDDVADLPVWRPAGFPWRRAAVLGNLDDDVNADVLLRHLNGRWYYYPMNGRHNIAAGRGMADLPADRAWSFAGLGDFDGDGGDEVLLRRKDGHWRRHSMAGRRQRAEPAGLGLPRGLDWRAAAVGDLDGDGRDDVLLRHWEDRSWRYFRSADSRQAGSGIAHLTRNPLYGVAAIGDLDGDGKEDVLLRRNDGVWYYYAMDGRRVKDRGGAGLTRNLHWQVARY